MSQNLNQSSSHLKAILGQSKAVAELNRVIDKMAPVKTNVLIIGESGTGKELVARQIHERGPLKGKPFVPVNCGAIPENLMESEFFGHKKGSFTGAVSDKPGLFEAANGGTLFLDEVGELPLHMQVKLLRSLQERVIKRVGGNDDIKVDVRIISATNRDLEAAIAKGTFREDLYYRLNVILITTPPLRERKGDMELLARFFVEKYAAKNKLAVKGISQEALEVLEYYPFPGNIRELENMMERSVMLELGTEVSVQSLPEEVRKLALKNKPAGSPTNPGELPSNALLGKTLKLMPVTQELILPAANFDKGPINLDQIIADVEHFYLLKALESSGGVKKKSAESLSLTFRSLRYRLSKLGLDDGPDTPEDE